MLTITITTPLGDIEIQHSKQTAKAVGSKNAVDFWDNDVQEGLFGVHGHLFDKTDVILQTLSMQPLTQLVCQM